MKFELNALSQYLSNNLKPFSNIFWCNLALRIACRTAADPNILADYVVALLKNDVPAGELQKLCAERLEVFLGDRSMSFTIKLFEALQEGSFQSTGVKLNSLKDPEASMSQTAVETLDLKSLLSKEDHRSSSSEPLSDPEDKENSDDDDRNHKHRRRDARENSFDNSVQEHPIRKFSRKKSRNYDNEQLYMETVVCSPENQKELSSSVDKEVPSRSEKRPFSIPPSMRPSSDLNSRARLNSSFRTDQGPRLDLSSSACRAPLGRGRGRNLASWVQPDSRFSSLDSLEFTPHMASQRPVHPGLFVAPSLQGAGSSQSASWGAFGFIHGISNGIMDSLHPLSLQTTLRPAINPMSLGISRQRCRDFEERGFCLRGDMCPMEHGVNRIVVEDVQSLSQFNLPVSIPNSHAIGTPAGAGPLHHGLGSSVLMVNKSLLSKNNKSAENEDALRLNGSTSVVGGESDVYDPDQPLWNNNTESSATLMRPPTPDMDDDSLWDGDASRKNLRISDGNEGDPHNRNLIVDNGSRGAGSSVWGRIGSENKADVGIKFVNSNSSTGHFSKGTRDGKEATTSSSLPSDQSKLVVSEECGSKVVVSQVASMPRADFEFKGGRMQQKACRTLYVTGIPQKNNRREALLSHFQKFGEILDIYIPLNSEKAFVQFCKREAAEAALNSPEAVMGNRFIKLFWANRDRISNEGQGSREAKSFQYPRGGTNFVRMRPPAVEVEKENLSSPAQRESNTKSVEAFVPSVGPQKGGILNGPKVLSSPKKKIKSLELLEELRKKQELLDQKRSEFQRQLVKFERQASIKKDGSSEQAVKRPKIDVGNSQIKTADSGSATISISGDFQDTGKSLESNTLSENFLSPNAKAHASTVQQCAQTVKQSARMPGPYSNRFKLDNRPTSFRVLPPLPSKLLNVAVLKDHFSKFGDLASVVFEDVEGSEYPGSKNPEKSFVCVTFLSRQSAEKAYQAGKFYEGCSLKLSWVIAASPVAWKGRHIEDIGSSNSVSHTALENDTKPGSMCSSSAVDLICKPPLLSNAGELGCTPLPEPHSSAKTEYGVNVELTDCNLNNVSKPLNHTLESENENVNHNNKKESMVDDGIEAGIER